MAKKDKQKNQENFNSDEAQKRMDKYIKSREGEKKGKAAAVSLIGGSVLILLLLLIIVLKLNGVGKTVMFTSDESGRVNATVVDTEDVDGKNVLDYIVDEVAGDDTQEEENGEESSDANAENSEEN